MMTVELDQVLYPWVLLAESLLEFENHFGTFLDCRKFKATFDQFIDLVWGILGNKAKFTQRINVGSEVRTFVLCSSHIIPKYSIAPANEEFLNDLIMHTDFQKYTPSKKSYSNLKKS